MDQAQNLRNMMSGRQPQAVPPAVSSRVITVTSGKGGVGKTNFTVNLAMWLASQKKRVVIIDTDFGLANIEVLFNVWPKCSFADVIRGVKSVPDILTEGPPGIKFISGGTGFKDLANVTDRQMAQITNSFGYLDEISDIILIDTGAGISKTVTTFVKASNEALIVTTPEPTSISDSYTLIKTVYEADAYSPVFRMIINKVDNEKEGLAVYERIKNVSSRFLNMTPNYLGSIAYDDDLVKAVKAQKPVMVSHPNSRYSRNVETIGNRLLMNNNNNKSAAERPGILSFMKRIAGAFSR